MEGLTRHSSTPWQNRSEKVSFFFISPLDIATCFTDLLKNKTWDLNIGQINRRDPMRNMTMMIDSALFFTGNGYPSSQNPAGCWNLIRKAKGHDGNYWNMGGGGGTSRIQKTVSTWRSKVRKDSWTGDLVFLSDHLRNLHNSRFNVTSSAVSRA